MRARALRVGALRIGALRAPPLRARALLECAQRREELRWQLLWRRRLAAALAVGPSLLRRVYWSPLSRARALRVGALRAPPLRARALLGGARRHEEWQWVCGGSVSWASVSVLVSIYTV